MSETERIVLTLPQLNKSIKLKEGKWQAFPVLKQRDPLNEGMSTYNDMPGLDFPFARSTLIVEIEYDGAIEFLPEREPNEEATFALKDPLFNPSAQEQSPPGIHRFVLRSWAPSTNCSLGTVIQNTPERVRIFYQPRLPVPKEDPGVGDGIEKVQDDIPLNIILGHAYMTCHTAAKPQDPLAEDYTTYVPENLDQVVQRIQQGKSVGGDSEAFRTLLAGTLTRWGLTVRRIDGYMESYAGMVSKEHQLRRALTATQKSIKSLERQQNVHEEPMNIILEHRHADLARLTHELETTPKGTRVENYRSTDAGWIEVYVPYGTHGEGGWIPVIFDTIDKTEYCYPLNNEYRAYRGFAMLPFFKDIPETARARIRVTYEDPRPEHQLQILMSGHTQGEKRGN